MKHILISLLVLTSMISCGSKNKEYNFRELGRVSTDTLNITLPCKELKIEEDETSKCFLEQGSFIVNYVGYEPPVVMLGGSGSTPEGHARLQDYLKDIVKGTKYETVDLDNKFMKLLCDDADNGYAEAWMILHRIAVDSGREAIDKTNLKVQAYDPFSGGAVVENLLTGESYFSYLSDIEDPFLIPLTEYYLQNISVGKWSLLNLHKDAKGLEYVKKRFDKIMGDADPDFFKRNPQIKRFEEISGQRLKNPFPPFFVYVH